MAEVPESLRAVTPVKQRLAKLAQAAGMTLGELALRYVLSQNGVACALTGVDNAAQLRENVAMFNRRALEPALLEEVVAAVPPLPAEILTPGQWHRGG